MQKVLLDVGETPTVVIQAIGGDLRISGREGAQLEAQAPEKGELKVEKTEEGVEISCRSGCLLFLPRGSKIDAGDIGGDGRITDTQGDVLIRTIGGDLSLRRMGKTSLERVGGDAQIREVEGDLMIDHIGGDAVIQGITGDTRLRRVGGDLLLGEVSGSIEVMIGGDAVVDLKAIPGTVAKVQAGSDLSCRLPKDPSARIQLQVGGEMHVPSGLVSDGEAQTLDVTLGGGEAEIELSAGGDLQLKYGKSTEGYDADFVGGMLSEVDVKLAEMEAHFNALGIGMDSFDADRIGERVRRSVRQAQHRAERATQKAEDVARKARGKHLNFKFDVDGEWPDLRFADFTESQPVVSDEERLTILHMVENGKLSVDDAEALLQALEGES
ncbi:MAG: hypothetical protein E4G99_06340 [Anaerolineales bacterium]|nr:MAG: hypothetical protein E4G99_06340 [Anaerolineales bacterium]